MATIMAEGGETTAPAAGYAGKPDLGYRARWPVLLLFLAVLVGGVIFTLYSVNADIAAAPGPAVSRAALVLLGIALLTALGFEFVNGFHDTANAVATVIYTHAMPPTMAVVWSGLWNFLGVLSATGAVAFGIISLLPVELILQVDSGAGYAMVFALLIGAIVWNLGTWFMGLPSSSSHTLIGSIIGVGVANQLMHVSGSASGVDWGKAKEIGLSLLISPILGFVAAALLLLVMKRILKSKKLFAEPAGTAPPPPAIRALLVVTCTLVSFFHGSNDGQKGMGLIMLILIGTVPAAYALNTNMQPTQVVAFADSANRAEAVLTKMSRGVPAAADPRAAVKTYLQTRMLTPDTLPSLAALAHDIGVGVRVNGTLAQVPVAEIGNLRSEMYMVSETLRVLDKSNQVAFDAAGKATIKGFKSGVDSATRFIPGWVKVVIAISLGLGTMVGWKRIVKTVGERIGKSHLTYAQGASAEIVAAAMIGVADGMGLPVSTTHVLSSGVAGTMVANGSGLHGSTLRNLGLAWVLTLPASMLLAGLLYALFVQLV
jgi:PiT family inorganic phosphate transporter